MTHLELFRSILQWSKAKNHSYMSYLMGLPPELENGLADFLGESRHSEWKDFPPKPERRQTPDDVEDAVLAAQASNSIEGQFETALQSIRDLTEALETAAGSVVLSPENAQALDDFLQIIANQRMGAAEPSSEAHEAIKLMGQLGIQRRKPSWLPGI